MSDIQAVLAADEKRVAADNAVQNFLNELGAEEARDMSGEQKEQYDKLNKAYEFAAETARDVMVRAQKNAEMDEARAALNLPDDLGGSDKRPFPSISDEVRSFEQWMKDGAHGTFSFANHTNSTDIEARGRMFGGLETRDLTTTTATGAAELVPSTTYNGIWNGIYERSMILQSGARILNTTTGEPMSMPKKTARQSAVWTAEGVALNESDPTTGDLDLGKKKLGNISAFTKEFERDSVIGAGQWIIEDGIDVLSDGANAGFMVGAGSATEPTGLISATGQTLSDVGAPTMTEIIDLIHSVKDAARRPSVFFFKDTSIAELRKLADTDGRFLWEASNQAGAPSVLHGYPVYGEPSLAAHTAASSVIGVFGNMRGFVVRRIGGIEVSRSEEYKWNEDKVAYKFTMSADSGVLDDSLVSTLSNP